MPLVAHLVTPMLLTVGTPFSSGTCSMHHTHIEIVTIFCQAHIVFYSCISCPSIEVSHSLLYEFRTHSQTLVVDLLKHIFYMKI